MKIIPHPRRYLQRHLAHHKLNQNVNNSLCLGLFLTQKKLFWILNDSKCRIVASVEVHAP
jgi:hypothetical protein